MPDFTTLIEDPSELAPCHLAGETEVSLLAAGDPVFSDFKPDDYKAYIRFRICTSFPKIIGPESHGRYFGFHPQVLLKSYRSLLHQQTNLGHTLKVYGGYRDRIQGGIVGVSVAKGGSPYKGASRVPIPDGESDALYLDVIAVLWKMADGNKELLGRHVSARQKTSVSIEVGTTLHDLWVYDPRDRSIHALAAAMEQWPGLVKRDKKKGVQIGSVDGVQFAFAAGGEDGSVPFRGVGYTPNPAEGATAKVVDLAAEMEGDDVAFAATLVQDWEAGMEVAWSPIFQGLDAGCGIVREVVTDGSVERDGMLKAASPADPLLVIKVHGRNYEVVRHASSLEKK